MKKFFSHYAVFVEEMSKAGEQSIFRGHADANWKIQSSYRRLNENRLYRNFLTVGYAELPVKKMLSSYDLPNKNLQDLNNIQTLQYLQHYGVPTPLIDFTFDYNVALYFAGSQLTYSTLRSNCEVVNPYDPKLSKNDQEFLTSISKKFLDPGNLTEEEHERLFDLKPDCYIDIIAIDVNMLTDKVVDLSNKDMSYGTHTYIYSNEQNNDDFFEFGIFTILEPHKKSNENLKRQKGAFIYFDSNTDLEKYFEINQDKFPQFPIIHNLILKTSLNFWGPSQQNNCTLYQYLKNKKCTGKELFKDDYQCLKFDLNYLSGE